MAGWAITGIYFAFPDPFNDLFDALNTDPGQLHAPRARMSFSGSSACTSGAWGRSACTS